MHIICEQCQMRFKVKRGAIKKQGRVVRCGNCEYEWVAKPSDSNIIYKRRKSIKILAFIIPLLLVIALALFAFFLRNDESFYFLKLNDNHYLSIEGIDTNFYKEESGSYAIIKAKIHNMSDETRRLDSILLVMEGQDKKRTVIDEMNINILPNKSIIVPLRIEDVRFEMVRSEAYLGGKNLLVIKSVFV